MLVYHGTTPQQARAFAEFGINAHIVHKRKINGPQDNVPGLFVTPSLSTAREFGLCVIEIEVEIGELKAPPIFEQGGVSLAESLANTREPQAFLSKRVEPASIRIVECRESWYAPHPHQAHLPQA